MKLINIDEVMKIIELWIKFFCQNIKTIIGNMFTYLNLVVAMVIVVIIW